MVRFTSTKTFPPVSNNWGLFGNAEFDELIAKARSTFEDGPRDAALAALHKRIVEEAPFVWIAHDVGPRAMSTKVKGVVQPKSWFIDIARCRSTEAVERVGRAPTLPFFPGWSRPMRRRQKGRFHDDLETHSDGWRRRGPFHGVRPVRRERPGQRRPQDRHDGGGHPAAERPDRPGRRGHALHRLQYVRRAHQLGPAEHGQARRSRARPRHGMGGRCGGQDQVDLQAASWREVPRRLRIHGSRRRLELRQDPQAGRAAVRPAQAAQGRGRIPRSGPIAWSIR